MKRGRWAKAMLPLFGFCACGVVLGQSCKVPAPTPVVPQGYAQTPIRLCVVRDFGKVKGEAIEPDHIGTLVQGPPGDDNFYGATAGGGANGKGAVYQITPSGELTVLYSFDGGLNGSGPQGGVTLGSDGWLYGTTNGGGKFAVGTIFKIDRAVSKPTLLYAFRSGRIDPPLTRGQQPTQQQLDDAAGAYPTSAPVQGADGLFYGVTESAAGLGNAGTLYQVSSAGDFKCLRVFTSKDAAANGAFPISLTRGTKDNFYGVTWEGGLRWGTIFEFDPLNKSGASAGITTIYKINNARPKPQPPDGTQPFGVTEGADGNLYGTMYAGGPVGRGVVFSLTMNGTYTILHAFGGNASNPTAGVIEVEQKGSEPPGSPAPPTPNYYIYGASAMQGSVVTREDTGILFRVRPDGKEFSTVYNFDGTTGVYPSVTPILGRDSNIYGTTYGGGKYDLGALYMLDTMYLVSGIAVLDKVIGEDKFHERLIFEGNPDGKTWIHANSIVQASTHMAGFQPDATEATKETTSDGITIRAKDLNSTIVQFLYREKIVNGVDQPGLVDQITLPALDMKNPSDRPNAYDPNWTYGAKSLVTVGDQYWLSIDRNNKGNPPQDGSKYWTRVDANGCTSKVHSCYPLTTDSMNPKWLPDAELPEPDYSYVDTQLGCDGITIFDSPDFLPAPHCETWRFTALDLIVVNRKVVWTVKWQLEKPPGAPQKYNFVSLAPAPDPVMLGKFRKLLTDRGFASPF